MTNDEWLRLYSQALGGGTSLTPAGGVADMAALWASAPAPTTGRAANIVPGGGSQGSPGNPQTPSYLSGFGRSALESVPELFGVQPSQPTQDWRAANPVGSLGSQVLGHIGPYGVGLAAGKAALRAVPQTKALLDGLAELGTIGRAHPVAAKFAETALELAPFELARIGAASLIGDEGEVANVAQSAALDLVIGPVLPAAWSAVKAIRGPRFTTVDDQLKSTIPEFDPSAAPQQKLQRLYGLAGTQDQSLRDVVDSAIVSYERQVRTQGMSASAPEGRFVGKLWDGADQGEVRRLFKTNVDDSAPVRRPFMEGVKTGFPTREAWINEAKAFGMPDDWLAYVQYPRSISFKTPQQAEAVQASIQRNLRQVHNGWFIEPEADTSLFVMARKLPGQSQAALPDDKWLVFKTSDPNKFLGNDVIQTANARLAKFNTKIERGHERQVLADFIKEYGNDSVVAMSRGFRHAAPPTTFREKIANNLDLFLKLTPKEFQTATKANLSDAADAWQYVKGRLAPGMAQFRGQPLAEWVRIAAQNIADTASAKSNFLSFGDQGLKPGEGIFKHIVNPRLQAGGVEGLVTALKEEDMGLVTRFVKARASISEIVEGTRHLDEPARERIRALFTKLAEVDKVSTDETIATQRLYSAPQLEPLPNHYGVSHTWRGDWRQRVFDDRGKTIAMGGGKTAQEAADEAAKLAQKLGGKVTEKAFRSNAEDDLLDADRILQQAKLREAKLSDLHKRPLTFNERLDVMGFAGDETPLTRRELADIVHANIKNKYKHIAGLVMRHDLLPEILQTGHLYGSEVFNQLVTRLGQIMGNKGLLDKLQNKAVGKMLGGLVGHNAADKLVRVANETEMHLTLNAFNLGHVALNALTFIQTMLPRLALIRGLPPARIGEMFGFIPDISAAGQTQGFISFLEPMRIAAKGFKAMAKPTPDQRDMFARASRESVVAPKFMEEWIGQKSLWGKQAIDMTGSKYPVIEMMRRISNFAPAKMEELARGHAFMTGLELANIMGVTNREAAYQVAKQFTFRTMYQYTAADRPRVFAGPIGSLYGLFKNWSFHYMNDLSQYAGEAFLRNNWSPLLWAIGGNAAMAGVGGLPFYGAAAGFYKMATGGRTPLEDLYENVKESAADPIYFGLPSFLNISLQANASGPFSNPSRDFAYLRNAAILDRIRKVGQFLDYTASQFGIGANPFEYDRTWDWAAYALSPRALYKATAQVEDGALKAIRNGQPIIQGIPFHEKLLNSFGLTPLKISKAYELSEELWSDREKVKASVQSLGEAYAQAHLAQDQARMAFVVSRAVETGLDLSSVMKSAATRLQNQQRPILPYEFRKSRDVHARLDNLGLSEP